MKTKEFNLSERIINQEPKKWIRGYPVFDEVILKKDVKEFIRLLKEVCKNKWLRTEEELEEINKLAGKKLIEKK